LYYENAWWKELSTLPLELYSPTYINIDIEILHIYLTMRRKGNPIHAEESLMKEAYEHLARKSHHQHSLVDTDGRASQSP
jgi:hypothetical protein